MKGLGLRIIKLPDALIGYLGGFEIINPFSTNIVSYAYRIINTYNRITSFVGTI